MNKTDEIKKESVDKVLSEEIEGYYREPLVEMARINKNETGRCFFPYNGKSNYGVVTCIWPSLFLTYYG